MFWKKLLGWQENGAEKKSNATGGKKNEIPSWEWLGWRQDNGNRSNQKSKFDFLATRQRLVKIDEGQQKIKIIRPNRQSNLPASCQSIFSLSRHLPTLRFREWFSIFHWSTLSLSNKVT